MGRQGFGVVFFRLLSKLNPRKNLHPRDRRALDRPHTRRIYPGYDEREAPAVGASPAFGGPSDLGAAVLDHFGICLAGCKVSRQIYPLSTVYHKAVEKSNKGSNPFKDFKE